VLGDLLVAAGLLLIWLVFRANSYAASTVTVEPEQPVISTGPYALMRHPMYSGSLLLLLGVALSLSNFQHSHARSGAVSPSETERLLTFPALGASVSPQIWLRLQADLPVSSFAKGG
jgi:hypothetical protein